MVSYEPHYFGDFEEGQTFSSVERTITQGMVDQFAMITGDWAEHHTSEEYAADSMFGGRIAHGFLVYSAGTGLLYQTGVFTRSLVAVTEVSISFPNPTYVGDTISVEFTVTDTTERAPFEDMGTVEIDAEITNASGATVCDTEAGFIVEEAPA
jgi:acyl dehydratase